MEQMKTAFAGSFASKRLIYRPIEDNEADRAFIHETASDIESHGLASPALLRPNAKKDSNKDFDGMIDAALLRVIICLPNEVNVSDDELKSRGKKTVEMRERAIPIGTVFLTKQRSDMTTHWRWTRMAISISDKYQNQGYGAEAINWAVDWAFNFAGMHRVELGTASFNERAAALYQRLGFKVEGRRRETIFMNRKWYDLIEFGMLEHEWEALRASKA